MQLTRKDVLDMASLSVEEINLILDTAVQMREISTRPIKKVPTLRGKTVIHFFYEPSTRTKTSFDIAAKRLSADSLSLSKSTSSLVKGETLIDTARNLEAMNPDVIILRHSSAGAPPPHRAPRALQRDQCRRRPPCPPDPGPARHAHRARAQGPCRGAFHRHHRRHCPQPRGTFQLRRVCQNGRPGDLGRSAYHDSQGDRGSRG